MLRTFPGMKHMRMQLLHKRHPVLPQLWSWRAHSRTKFKSCDYDTRNPSAGYADNSLFLFTFSSFLFPISGPCIESGAEFSDNVF